MPVSFNPAALDRIHDAANVAWHDAEQLENPSDVFSSLVLAQHRTNFDLWHQEDDARDPHAADARIAEVKHAIDRINQQRNDLVERIDLLLLELAGDQNSAAPLHSETPGMMIDRLSILALKIFHTAAETDRASASAEHRARNLNRLRLLRQQRADLSQCLQDLWAEVLDGRRRFLMYHQFKMYNDPALNPVLYAKASDPPY